MMENRVSLELVQKRLKSLSTLSTVLDDRWLAMEYQKPVDRMSLFAGWLSIKEWNHTTSPFGLWLNDLDCALALIKENVREDVWRSIRKKIRAHSDRNESKGILSEIAVYAFLARNGIAFEIEKKLTDESQKDVDLSIRFEKGYPLYIEVQWVSASDQSDKGSAIASIFEESYPYDFPDESYRIKLKIYDKTHKFTENHNTFVALNCTDCPELSSTVEGVVNEAFTGHDVWGEPIEYANSKIDTAIRLLVDGVIWFELVPGNCLLPLQRRMKLNPISPHKNEISTANLQNIWRPH